jgi:hypothetical protein
MALNKAILKAEIKAIMTDMRTREENADDEYADRLSTAIDTFIKTAQVNAGIPVSTTGTAAAQTGATTAPGTLS